jgi:hypothetical protein
MVLQFEPALGNCRWVDFVSPHKSHAAMVKALKAGVRRGEWSGWRLITVHQQSIGNEENQQ